MKEDKKTALLIIDMINKMDFDCGNDLLEQTLPITDTILSLKEEGRSKGVPVIYVNDNFGLWQDNVPDLIEECKQGIGRPVIERMLPEEDDYFIIKPKHSGFFGTQLHILLQQLGVERLILTGVAGNICVLFTANDAYMRGYDLWVPRDGVASECAEDNENAFRIIERSLSANTGKTTETGWDHAFYS
ncbi:cysteine hydrolase family protein [Halobacillus sp. KGW1]|uniref:cysteine hydrolase family protein n=1 Tax=Halobacillus sp. KGW1 TaxID=1793726 RepID=UPI0009ECFE95|nr:isochorismatase family cysteine hydrolase [Halobacillus sp. KGW1]